MAVAPPLGSRARTWMTKHTRGGRRRRRKGGGPGSRKTSKRPKLGRRRRHRPQRRPQPQRRRPGAPRARPVRPGVPDAPVPSPVPSRLFRKTFHRGASLREGGSPAASIPAYPGTQTCRPARRGDTQTSHLWAPLEVPAAAASVAPEPGRGARVPFHPGRGSLGRTPPRGRDGTPRGESGGPGKKGEPVGAARKELARPGGNLGVAGARGPKPPGTGQAGGRNRGRRPRRQAAGPIGPARPPRPLVPGCRANFSPAPLCSRGSRPLTPAPSLSPSLQPLRSARPAGARGVVREGPRRRPPGQRWRWRVRVRVRDPGRQAPRGSARSWLSARTCRGTSPCTRRTRS